MGTCTLPVYLENTPGSYCCITSCPQTQWLKLVKYWLLLTSPWVCFQCLLLSTKLSGLLQCLQPALGRVGSSAPLSQAFSFGGQPAVGCFLLPSAETGLSSFRRLAHMAVAEFQETEWKLQDLLRPSLGTGTASVCILLAKSQGQPRKGVSLDRKNCKITFQRTWGQKEVENCGHFCH